MTVKVAKWTIDEYHCMIDAGILRVRKAVQTILLSRE
jgi:hypothetical protein